MPKRVFRLREGAPLLDIVSYGRCAPENIGRLSPEQIELIARTVQRVPEVMVKVSGGGSSAKAVAAHFRYIDRRGDLEIETDDGEQLRGKGSEQDLLSGWDLDADAAEARSPYPGKPGRKPVKLVHNIVLSMPAGTSPDRLLAASRAFAREQFALKHRYAMVLHTDQDHPHVHLVVKATSEQGNRLNIRKGTLREWREEFARHLREQGIAANATPRVVRGETKPHKRDGIYRAMLRGESTHMRRRAQAAAADLLYGKRRNDQGKAKLLKTRQVVERSWKVMGEMLAREGRCELAEQVSRFVERMPPPSTEWEWFARELEGHTRRSQTRNQASSR